MKFFTTVFFIVFTSTNTFATELPRQKALTQFLPALASTLAVLSVSAILRDQLDTYVVDQQDFPEIKLFDDVAEEENDLSIQPNVDPIEHF